MQTGAIFPALSSSVKSRMCVCVCLSIYREFSDFRLAHDDSFDETSTTRTPVCWLRIAKTRRGSLFRVVRSFE